ncbi:MAG TPA: exodeoxyribonuclease VII small subunit, partial [Pseudonocardiaceae bacterium]
LEDSLALWERGEALATICERQLAGARDRVEAALAKAEDKDDAQS